jgi:hypothetical protein
MAERRRFPRINPKIYYDELQAGIRFDSPERIKNTGLYKLVRRLAESVVPSQKEGYDTRWFCFYTPARRWGKEIAVPTSIVRYRGTYLVHMFKLGYFEVRWGKRPVDEFYIRVVREMGRLMRMIRIHGMGLVERLVPYDLRVGRIRGKYVLEKVMGEKEKERILKLYREHQSRNLRQVGGCSLEEYLDVAAIGYRAAFGREAAGKGPLDLYKRYADGRHGGMLDIRDPKSREEFMRWYRSYRWAGSHPFEIVFSWHRHGILLYPPSENNDWKYQLCVDNFAYARHYLKMLRALIEHGVSFTAPDLEKVLDYLTGESYFSVNVYDELSFDYIPSREYKQKYFKHIEWKPLEVPKFRD